MVTAVLLNYKRPQNIPLILPTLLNKPYITEIIIANNTYQNEGVYARFTTSLRAKNQIIYTQDDDCLNPDIDTLFKKYQENPSKIVFSAPPYYKSSLSNKTLTINHANKPTEGLTTELTTGFTTAQCALIGWGSFFKKDKIPVLEEYLKYYPKDEFFLRTADRVFTLLQRDTHIWLETDIKHFKVGEEAMSAAPEHYKELEEVTKRCIHIISI